MKGEMNLLMNIQVLIIDDEIISLENSKQKISLYVPIENIHVATNSIEVMRILKSKPIDMAFIDLEMPGTDGFTIANYVKETQPKAKFAFLTGHAEMGAKSYDYDALDFLCKPVDVLRLKKTFEKYEKTLSTGNVSNQIAIETSNGFVLVSPNDIRYIAKENRKVVIYCENAEYVVKSSLDEMETIFSDFNLYRVHQSYLVPLKNIVSIEQSNFGNTYIATLSDESKIPVSRWKYASLRKYLQTNGVTFI